MAESSECIWDFLVDGVTDFFKGKNAARAADGAGRTVREPAGEAAGRGTRGAAGGPLGELDDQERFYDDLFDLQRESFGEYDDFLDDLRELQGGGLMEAMPGTYLGWYRCMGYERRWTNRRSRKRLYGSTKAKNA